MSNWMKYLPKVSSEDVDRIVKRDFPLDTYESVMNVLNQYRSESGNCRVQLAALKVANGNIETLKSKIQEANEDYRSIITEAEYPIIFKIGFPGEEVTEVERQKIIDDDWKQYETWLYRK